MPSNNLERMLAIMELFDENHLEWTPEEIMGTLEYKRSTLYRYLKILSESGFLTILPNSGYTLSPKIINGNCLKLRDISSHFLPLKKYASIALESSEH